VPKKITWNFASMAESLRDSRKYSFKTPENVPFDFASFKKSRDDHIKMLNGAYESNWNRERIDLVHGTAKFTAPKEIEVDLEDGSGKTKFSAPHVCIASGGYPMVPKDIPGAEYGITNEGFFDIEELPSRVAIVGAGYIAVEVAGMMNAMGVEVHLFIRGQTFLRSFDPMIQETMTERYEAAGVVIHKGYDKFEKIERVSDGPGGKKVLHLTLNGEKLVFNELVWAIGRAPEVESLDLKTAGVKTGKKGYIIADGFQNTTSEGIYALGDVTGQMELTPGKNSSLLYTFKCSANLEA
jgi:glutathione reductase (NADPH)